MRARQIWAALQHVPTDTSTHLRPPTLLRGMLQLVVLVGALALITPNNPLQTSVAFSLLGYLAVSALVPRLSASFIKVGLKGADMLKPTKPVLPELMGVVAAVTYLFLMFFLIPFVFFKYLVLFSDESIDNTYVEQYDAQYSLHPRPRLFPHNKLAEYLLAVLCLQLTTLLGLFDDLFDIKWRHKFFLPAVALLPLLIVYYVDFLVTLVMVPPFVHRFPGARQALLVLQHLIDGGNWVASALLGLKFRAAEVAAATTDAAHVDLGVFYYAYMAAVLIFAPNSINILAGINGLEVGQSVVLALVFLVNDFCYLTTADVLAAAYDLHLFSALFIIPFVGVLVALLRHNWWPARCFVGDTYCYFSGMVFAIVGILGHFLKTLLIFLLPQILNFVYLVPQLFHVVPCPRHRLPRFDPKDGLMHPSFAELGLGSGLGKLLVTVLLKMGLVEFDGARFSNLTLINLALVRLGPMREDRLCMVLLLAQLVVGLVMVAVRHTVGPWIFGYDNLSWGVK